MKILRVTDHTRETITSIVKELGLKEEEFREVGKLQWKGIIEKMEEVFILKPRYNSEIYWYWEFLKTGYSISFDHYNAEKYLNQLVDAEEKVWFLAEGTRQRPKFWVYEGNLGSIQRLLAECSIFEYYIVSKKYHWLLCVNHHCYLIGSGEQMIQQMRDLADCLRSGEHLTNDYQ